MRRCPICKNRIDASTESRVAPFCSERCKLIDLGNWLGEGYRIQDGGEPLDVRDDERINRSGAEPRPADSPKARSAGGPRRAVAGRSDPNKRSERRERRRR